MSFRVLIVDDHPITRGGFRSVVETLRDDVSVSMAGSFGEACGRLQAGLKPDLILLDLNLPDAAGPTMVGALRREAPDARLITMSGLADEATVRACEREGALGFVPKHYSADRVMEIIRRAMDGESVPIDEYALPASRAAGGWNRLEGSAMNPSRPIVVRSGVVVSGGMVTPGSDAGSPHGPHPRLYSDGRHLGLTERQRDVLRLMMQGQPNKIICRELKLAEGTVKVHVSAILRALNVATRAQVVVSAIRHGIRFDE